MTRMSSTLKTPPVRVPPVIAGRPSWWRRSLRFVGAAARWLFGLASLIAALAVLATIPILNLLSLGYLLEVCGRVGQSKRIRDGFIGIEKAAVAGSIIAGTWLMILPLRFLSSLARDAYLIDPTSPRPRLIGTILTILTVLMVLHILTAWSAGGKLRHFFWPFALPRMIWHALRRKRRLVDSVPPLRFAADVWRGDWYPRARDALWDYLVSLRLPYYFWLGARGFAATMMVLLPPTLLMIGATELPRIPAILSGIIGVPLLAVVLLYLPFLQTRFAIENRFGAMFELWKVRQLFRRAPIAYWLALLVTLLFALPLYLLKIEFIPEEIAWLPSVVFVVFIWPARIMTGWAYGRSRFHEQPRFWLFRWSARLLGLPVVGIFVLVVFLSRYLSWYGVWSLFEQHAFLVPAPFFGH